MRRTDGVRAERQSAIALDGPDSVAEVRRAVANGTVARLRVTGGTMRPTFEEGDVIVLQSIEGGAVQVGDVVLGKTASGTALLHRVIRVSGRGSARLIVTRADGSSINDLPIESCNVVARAVGIEDGVDGLRPVMGARGGRSLRVQLLRVLRLLRWR